MTEAPPPELQRYMLELARRSLVAGVSRKPMPLLALDDLPPLLQEDGASFVTLTMGGELRGCIGSIEAVEPLAFDIQRHAVDAALADPRFPALTAAELQAVQLEISILSKPTPLKCNSPEERPSCLRPGVDGVLIRSGIQRATFLPQVWEKLPDAVQFLEFRCQKAYLPKSAWKSPEVEVLTYQVFHFDESLLPPSDPS